MSERPEDLRDEQLGARLKSALDAPPSRLHARLDRLAGAGLHPPRPRRGVRSWLEMGPQLAGGALVVAFTVAAIPRLWALAAHASAFGAPPLLAAPDAASALMLPLGVLLGVEAMRGAPTVRRWLG